MLISFKEEFLPLLEPNAEGEPEKCTTIRIGNRWKQGDRLQVCTGLRTMELKVHYEYKVLTVAQIHISVFSQAVQVVQLRFNEWPYYYSLNDEYLSKLIELEGFKSKEDFFKFFLDIYGEQHWFRGQLIVFGKAGLGFIEEFKKHLMSGKYEF